MKYRRLDSDHDYCFGRGTKDYLEDVTGGPNAIQQAIKTSLLLFLGEWWENTQEGLPLWQKILGQRANTKIIDNIIATRIRELTMPDGNKAVTKVSNIVSSYNATTRAYSFSCIVDTAFGKLVVSNSEQYVKSAQPAGATSSTTTWQGESVTWQGESVTWQGL